MSNKKQEERETMTDDEKEIMFPSDEETGDTPDPIEEENKEENDPGDVSGEETEPSVSDDDEEDEEEDDEAAGDDRAADLERRYMNLFAEYENFRKRSAKEKEDLYASAIATVTKEWLSVLDNIERAEEAGKNADESSVESVVKGIELIGKQAEDVLGKLGVKAIECERGTSFDPNLHEAVMHIEDEELGEQEVAQVFQKGYIYKDRVIRHTVVQVAN